MKLIQETWKMTTAITTAILVQLMVAFQTTLIAVNQVEVPLLL